MSKTLRTQILRFERQLQGLENANNPVGIDVDFVGYAFDAQGQLVFSDNGELAYMVYYTRSFSVGGVTTYPTPLMEQYQSTKKGRAEYNRIKARAARNYTAYTNRPREKPWRIRPHGQAIGKLCSPRGQDNDQHLKK